MVYFKEKKTFDLNMMRMDATKACICFSAASVSMILLNKGVAMYFPGSMAFILMLQNLTTIGILKTTSKSLLCFERRTALNWVPCAVFFSLNIYSSLKAMAYVNVATFTLLRNLQPLIVIAVNFYSKTEPTPQMYSLYYLLCILFGAFVYAYHDIAYDRKGYVWCFIHIVSMSLYAVFVKLKSVSAHAHSDTYFGGMSATDMSWYNNILSIPILGFVFFVEMVYSRTISEGSSFVYTLSSEAYNCVSAGHLQCQSVTVCSMVGAYIISVVGFHAQRVLSPIGWVTLNNISKFPAIVLSQLFWPSQLTGMEWIGVCFALASGYCYAVTKQDAMFQPSKNNKMRVACCFGLVVFYVIMLMFPADDGWALEYV